MRLPNGSQSKRNPRLIKASQWPRTWQTGHPRQAGYGPGGRVCRERRAQARQAASNLYDQGSRSGEYVRQYAAQEPFTALLIAGAIGFALGYLVRGR
jgi:hypothetical protein